MLAAVIRGTCVRGGTVGGDLALRLELVIAPCRDSLAPAVEAGIDSSTGPLRSEFVSSRSRAAKELPWGATLCNRAMSDKASRRSCCSFACVDEVEVVAFLSADKV